MAVAKSSGTAGAGSTGPVCSTARCRKPSMRENAASASATDSSLYSMVER
jgi:hypothetical protein